MKHVFSDIGQQQQRNRYTSDQTNERQRERLIIRNNEDTPLQIL